MKVIVLGEKHDTRLVKYSVENMRAIIADRLQQGYYDDEGLKRAKELTTSHLFINNPKAGFFLESFLSSRSDYEYENFRIEEIEEEYSEA